jgi:pantoate--beta-alanine ligase
MIPFTITRTVAGQQRLSRDIIRSGKTIAVVPSMGALHDGHLSLIHRARRKADIVVVTVFVNPTQFAPNEDFERYPRDPKGDIRKIQEAGGKIVFMPKRIDMYPDGFETYITVDHMTGVLEGRSRPGHFRGVTTIVAKLFNIVRPDVALFGMKDYQQAMVLKRMVKDLDWPITVIVCPTVREKDGLAMSSRNRYLSPELRAEAPALFKALKTARQMVRDGTTRSSDIKRKMRSIIKKNAPHSEIDYVAITEMESLKPVSTIVKHSVASLAVRLGPVRLIDNMKIA